MKLTVATAFDIIENETFSVAQTAELLKCARQNVKQLIDRNSLDARKIGQDYRITRESIDDYAKSRVKSAGKFFDREIKGKFKTVKL